MKTGRKTCKIPDLICDWCIFKNSVDLIALMNSRSHQMTMKTHSCSCTRKANLSEIHMMISHTLFIEQQPHLNRNRLKIRDKASHFFPLIIFLLHLSFMLLWTYQQAFHLFDWRHWFSSECFTKIIVSFCASASAHGFTPEPHEMVRKHSFVLQNWDNFWHQCMQHCNQGANQEKAAIWLHG